MKILITLQHSKTMLCCAFWHKDFNDECNLFTNTLTVYLHSHCNGRKCPQSLKAQALHTRQTISKLEFSGGDILCPLFEIIFSQPNYKVVRNLP